MDWCSLIELKETVSLNRLSWRKNPCLVCLCDQRQQEFHLEANATVCPCVDLLPRSRQKVKGEQIQFHRDPTHCVSSVNCFPRSCSSTSSQVWGAFKVRLCCKSERQLDPAEFTSPRCTVKLTAGLCTWKIFCFKAMKKAWITVRLLDSEVKHKYTSSASPDLPETSRIAVRTTD